MLVVKGKTVVDSPTINSPLCCKVTAVPEAKLARRHLSTEAAKRNEVFPSADVLLADHIVCLTPGFVSLCAHLFGSTICASIVSEVKRKQTNVTTF